MSSESASQQPVAHILGIRHHGPGSARAVREALDELQPDAVLIEGPPELDGVAGLANDEAMRPPVAALVYAPDNPKLAGFYPFASFSPEWVALRWAHAAGVPVHFADLPATHSLVLRASPDHAETETETEPGLAADEGLAAETETDEGLAADDEAREPTDQTIEVDPRSLVRNDPIGALADAAGHDDAERWWEDAIEHRYHGAAIFDAVREAMIPLREDDRAAVEAGAVPDVENAMREAAMRKILRATIKRLEAEPSAATPIDDGLANVEARPRSVAFICGAWHVPGLVAEGFASGKLPSQKDDNALLKGLPKVKVAATWVPWTSGRLARSSGYGAGIQSPGWYQHLFAQAPISEDRPDPGTPSGPGEADTSANLTSGNGTEISVRWMVKIARLLRGEQLDASSASVIEAVRLAETLAAVRERPIAGLSELHDAARAVLAGGSDLPLDLIAKELLVGTELGEVPPNTPMVPLAEDLARLQKRLRLKPSAADTEVKLDLRQTSHLERSTLFHRLVLLGIWWAVPDRAGRSTGTFKEQWKLNWQPEYAVAVIEASGAGTTIETAASATVVQHAREGNDLARLTEQVEACLLADLPDALAELMSLLAERTARHHDTPALMGTIEPLARVRRYGNVRGAETASVQTVIDGLLARIAIGLPGACSNVDDDAVAEIRDRLDSVQRGLGTLDDAGLRAMWEDALLAMIDHRSVHGVLAGRGVRSLLDAGRLDIDEVRARLSRSLSSAADPIQGAGYLEGFLSGDALLLIHDQELLAVIDGWVGSVGETQFDALVPLLRRSFAAFTKPERRIIGEHVKAIHTGTGGPGGRVRRPIDPDRAAAVRPVLQLILGPRRETQPAGATASPSQEGLR